METLKIHEIEKSGYYVQLRKHHRPEMLHIVVRRERFLEDTVTITSEYNSSKAKIITSVMSKEDDYIKIDSSAPGYGDWQGELLWNREFGVKLTRD